MDNENNTQTIRRTRLPLAVMFSIVAHVSVFVLVYFFFEAFGVNDDEGKEFALASSLQVIIGEAEEESLSESSEGSFEVEMENSDKKQSVTQVINSGTSFGETIRDKTTAESLNKLDVVDSGSAKKGEQNYRTTIMNILNKHRRYHKVARQRGIEGKNMIQFSVSKEGVLVEYEIIESSGEHLLDKSAIQMVLDSSPFPPFPNDLNATQLQFQVPLQFSLGS